MSDDRDINSYINLFYIKWCGLNSLVKWNYKILKINNVSQKLSGQPDELYCMSL